MEILKLFLGIFALIFEFIALYYALKDNHYGVYIFLALALVML